MNMDNVILQNSMKILAEIYVGNKEDIDQIYAQVGDSGKPTIIVEAFSESVTKFIPSTINSIPVLVIIKGKKLIKIESEEDMAKKNKTKSTNPFIEIAKYYPFSEKLIIASEQMPDFINELVNKIDSSIKAKEDQSKYNKLAALHLRFLYDDYGTEVAANYWKKLLQLDCKKFGTDFYQASRINDILNKVYQCYKKGDSDVINYE